MGLHDRVDRSRVDGGHRDARIGQFSGELPCEHIEPRLRGGVRAEARERVLRGARGHVDDAAPAGSDHAGQDSVGQEEWGYQIEDDGLLPLARVEFPTRSKRTHDPRIVHQDGNRSEGFRHRRRHVPSGVPIREINGEGERTAALLPDSTSSLLDLLGATGDESHIGTLAPQFQSRRSADETRDVASRTELARHAPAARPGWRYLTVLLIATFLMASSFIAGKILLRSVPAFSLLGARFILAAAATLPFAVIAARRRDGGPGSRALPASPRSLLAIVIIGLLQTAAVLGLTFLALRTITAGEASILLFTNPIWVAALAPLLLSERLSAVRLLGLAIGVVGVVLAMGGLHRLSGIQGDVLVLLASLAWASSTIITKRLHVAMNAWWLTFWQMLTGALILLGVAVLLGQSWPGRLSALSRWAVMCEGREMDPLRCSSCITTLLCSCCCRGRSSWLQGRGG